MRNVALVLVFCSGCGASIDDPALEGGAGELVGGARTSARPEIGFISITGQGSCTATLIRPDVAITAAHCVDYGSALEEGDYGWMGLDLPSGRAGFTIDRYASFGGDIGADDIALVHLATPVPASSATPTTVADERPARGDAITLFGYGCTARSTGEGTFEKRAAPAAFGKSERLCPGDSGGPAVLGEDGPVVAINSGYFTSPTRDDIFADPIALRAAIEARIQAWGPPPAPENVAIANATGGPLWARCDGAAGPGCSGWTLIESGARGRVETFRRKLVLENQGLAPGFTLSDARVIAPGLDVTVHPNPGDPFTAPDATGGASACLGGELSTRAALAPFAGHGQVCAGRDAWWAITAAEGQTVAVDVAFAHASGDVDLQLYGPGGGDVARSETTTDRESIRHRVTTGGTHWVRAFGYRGAGNAVEVRIALE